MTAKAKSGIIAAALLSLAAYASANYLLAPAVVDSGGGHASSTNYQLDASIGGPVVLTSAAAPENEAASANYTLQVNTVSLMDEPASPPSNGGGDDDSGGCSPGEGRAIAGALLLLFVSLVVIRRIAATAIGH